MDAAKLVEGWVSFFWNSDLTRANKILILLAAGQASVLD
jgi:hypothetical protein